MTADMLTSDTADTLTVRAAVKEDIPAIAALEQLCFSVPWSEGALADTLASPHARLFCAELGGAVIAYGGCYLLGDDADITNIATHPDFRRRGAAAAVLQVLSDCAKAHGMQAIHLEVRASNAPAIALYERFGFAVDGIRKNYYKNPTENAVLMTLSLQE
ncbi:MAG: ribosomal protein S18-alanine N-acetyltransferase [Clostridia bacterium]|nr:ribosomal protein S18-alanine N-acetyltransferase [Clostridia bacterium]